MVGDGQGRLDLGCVEDYIVMVMKLEGRDSGYRAFVSFCVDGVADYG